MRYASNSQRNNVLDSEIFSKDAPDLVKKKGKNMVPIILNLCLGVFKYICGTISGLSSIILDAANNLSATVITVMTVSVTRFDCGYYNHIFDGFHLALPSGWLVKGSFFAIYHDLSCEMDCCPLQKCPAAFLEKWKMPIYQRS